MTPSLLGVPLEWYRTNITAEVQIINARGEVIGTYTGTGRSKVRVAMYHGYGQSKAARLSDVQALRLALTRPTATRQSQFVCRACVRQYHPSPILSAELPFWKRITNSLFGSSEQKAATEKRDEAHQQRLQELAEQGGGKTETIVDDKGRTWTIAAVVDPSINKQYVQAQRWDGLEWVGSKEWIARKNDSGEAYVG